MKKITLLYSLLFFSLCVNAQKENDIWYFGKGVGLDFNFTPPKPLTGSNITSIEGTASISDNNGRLLFYSNGVNIYNRKNEIMLNGKSILGDPSSTNNVVIVPLPNSTNLYYLFAISSSMMTEQQLSYNIIDINGDGGYGEVIEKNTIVEDNTFEKLAVVKHCDNKKAWIIIHKWQTDEYHAFLMDGSGLNMIPVISHTGLVIKDYENNTLGTLKSSVDGKKLVAVHSFDNDLVELMDFDYSTGVISNPITFKPNTIPRTATFIGAYGAEFSPNGNLLYVSSNNSLTTPAIVYQFDITSGNAVAITASKQVIAQPSVPFNGGALQMGPDRKIYFATWKNNALSVIENPDIAGSGCNYQQDKIVLGPSGSETVQYGLPTLIQTNLNPAYARYDFTRGGKCTDLNVQYTISKITGMDSVRWSFGDAQESTTLSPLHNYLTAGYYDVELIVYKKDCAGVSNNDTIKRNIWIAANEDLLPIDTSACIFKDLTIASNITVTNANYLWSTGDVTTSTVTHPPGKFWFEIEQNGCKVSDTINITIKATPIVELGSDTSVCYSKPFILTAVTNLPATYAWNTGATSKQITINKPGKYIVKITAACEATDSINVVTGDCDFFIPNAFTPNGDTKNDDFGILNDFAAKEFSMQIFNRYGNIIFTTTNKADRWNGTYKGKDVPMGNYTWIIHYINTLGYTKSLKGTVLVLR